VRDLIIVAQHEQPLYGYLSQHFTARPDVVVTLDRRQAERRHRREPPAAERRRHDRRLRSVNADLTSLGVAFVLVR
jgi:hypothetical protein